MLGGAALQLCDKAPTTHNLSSRPEWSEASEVEGPAFSALSPVGVLTIEIVGPRVLR
jgi:hypothetical protein